MNCLIQTIFRRDEHSLTQLLQQRTDDNQKQKDIDGALWMLACRKWGDTSLRYAKQFGIEDTKTIEKIVNFEVKEKIEYARILLSTGANPNFQSQGGLPILSYAISHSNLAFTELLLKSGSDPNGSGCGPDDHPVKWAVHVASKQILRLLVEREANPNVTDSDGMTPFGLVCYTGFKNFSHDPALFELLMSFSDLNVADSDCLTPLLHAVKNCKENDDFQTTITEKIIKSGKVSNLEFKDGKGMTALMHACQNLSFVIASALLEANASIETEDKSGRTVLHIAVGTSRARPLIDLLVQAGADINLNNGRQPPPLYYAAKAMQADNVMCLLEHNAYVPNTFEIYNLKRLHMINEGSKIMAMVILTGHNWDCIPVNYKSPRRFAFCYGSSPPDYSKILKGDILENYNQRVIFADRYTKPCSLKHQCRLNIRKQIGIGIKDKLLLLDIPKILKEYLLLVPELAWVFEVFSS